MKKEYKKHVREISGWLEEYAKKVAVQISREYRADIREMAVDERLLDIINRRPGDKCSL